LIKKKILILPFLFSLILSFFPVVSFANDQSLVYIVPIKNTVEKGLSEFINRAVETAEDKKADVIIFEMDTPGGAVDAAAAIGKIISNTKIKTVTYINQDAISAGAYIALNTDEIYMDDGGRFGAAGVIDGQGNTAGEKAQSYWLSAMRGAAEKGGRDPLYAMAMADKSIAIPELGDDEKKFLTLTAAESLQVKYSEGTVSNLEELLSYIGMENAKVERMDESFADKVARFVTNPLIIPILLSIGFLGLIFELFSPGFGIPGFIGISSLLLFFYGHLVAGLAGYETIILFAAGILLILLEFFIVGGIAGGLGIVAIIGSIFHAGGNAYHIAISICIAVAVSIIATILLVKVFGRKMKFFKKIVLRDSTSTEEGDVSNKTRNDLVGKIGITLTALRPAGTVIIGEERIDVVSEGRFIGKDVKVKIVKAEGSRIVVREWTDIDLHKEEN
jgi:membrane-bound serine protease (ClpP class)